MAEQRVLLTLVANNAGLIAPVGAANAEINKLAAAVERLGVASKGMAEGTGAASVGTGALARGAGAASVEVGNLGRSSAVAREELTLLGTGAEVTGGRVSSAMRLAAKSIPLLGLAAVAESIKMGGDFQQQTNVLVTAAGEAQSALGTVRKGILDVASSTGTKWQDATAGMYQLEKAGFNAAHGGLDILKASAQGAREEGANLATVVAATTSVMASYHLTSKDAVSVTNEIKTAAGEAKTTMELFAGSLSTVLPLASANKISFADVAGSLASLTQHGTTADQASQELAFTIRGLAAPNNVAVQTMGQLGISATDVATKLGDNGGRGLAGTLNYLSQTVLEKMGPDGLVLLNTFKQSSFAAKDLTTELGAMAPATRKLGDDLVTGAVTVGGYKASVKDLTGDQAVLAQQFLVSYNRAHSFNDAIRRGGPDAVTYSDQIKKMTGGAAGLNTVLQLTGESMAGTDERIAKIGAAAVGAGKDVSGWSSTQGLFNVKVAEFSQTAQAAAITIGERLLPAFSSMFGFLASNQTVLEALIIGLGGAATAIAVYTVATKVGTAASATWAAVTGGLATVMDLVAGRTSLTALAFSAETVAKLRSAQAGLALNASLLENATAARLASGAIMGFGTAVSALVTGAVGLGALYLGVSYATDKLTTSMMKAHPSVTQVSRDLLDAQRAPGAGGLSKDLADLDKATKTFTDNSPSIGNKLKGFAQSLISFQGSADLKDAKASYDGMDKALAGLVKSGNLDAAATGFQTVAAAQARQGVSTQDLLKHLPGYKSAMNDLYDQQNAAASGTDRLTKAQDDLKAAQDNLNGVLQTSIDKFTILNNGALTTERANEALVTKTNALTEAVKTNGRSLDLTSASGIANRQAVLDLISASNDKITADFKSTQATQGTGAALDAMSGQVVANRQHLIDSMVQAGFSKDAAKAMADQFLLTPAQIATQFNTPGLADAQGNVDRLKATYDGLQSKTIHIDAVTSIIASGDAKSTAGGTIYKAAGGPIHGPGTGTSDSVPIMGSNGEHMVTAAEVTAAGGHGAVERWRASLLRGYAAGGPIITSQFDGWQTDAISRGMTAMMGTATSSVTAAAQSKANTAASAAYAGPMPIGDAVNRWAPLASATLAELGLAANLLPKVLRQIQTESGGNPNATQGNIGDVNNRSGDLARGLMQVIGATFRTYAGPYLSLGQYNPHASLYAGLNYGQHAYGPNLSALGQGHGYDSGGVANGSGFMAKATIAPERVLSPTMTPTFEHLVQVLERPDFASWVRAAAITPSSTGQQQAGTTSRQELALTVRAVTDDSVARAVADRTSRHLRNQLTLQGLQ